MVTDGKRPLLDAEQVEVTMEYEDQRGPVSEANKLQNPATKLLLKVWNPKGAGMRAVWPCSERFSYTNFNEIYATYQLKLCLSSSCYADGLYAFLAVRLVEETNKSLVRLDTVCSGFVDDLEGEFEDICLRQIQWVGYRIRQGKSTVYQL